MNILIPVLENSETCNRINVTYCVTSLMQLCVTENSVSYVIPR